MSEQVSHHPPVSAFQCDSRNNGERWRFYGSILPKAKFSLKNMEVNPKGLLTLELKRFPIDENNCSNDCFPSVMDIKKFTHGKVSPVRFIILLLDVCGSNT